MVSDYSDCVLASYYPDMTFPNDSFILLLNNIFYFSPPLSAKIAAGAVVCVESEIRGDVTIGDTISFYSRHIFCYFIPAF